MNQLWHQLPSRRCFYWTPFKRSLLLNCFRSKYAYPRTSTVLQQPHIFICTHNIAWGCFVLAKDGNVKWMICWRWGWAEAESEGIEYVCSVFYWKLLAPSWFSRFNHYYYFSLILSQYHFIQYYTYIILLIVFSFSTFLSFNLFHKQFSNLLMHNLWIDDFIFISLWKLWNETSCAWWEGERGRILPTNSVHPTSSPNYKFNISFIL